MFEEVVTKPTAHTCIKRAHYWKMHNSESFNLIFAKFRKRQVMTECYSARFVCAFMAIITPHLDNGTLFE